MASFSKVSSEKGATWNVLVRIGVKQPRVLVFLSGSPSGSFHILPASAERGRGCREGLCVPGLQSFGPDTGPLGCGICCLMAQKGRYLGCAPSVPG